MAVLRESTHHGGCNDESHEVSHRWTGRNRPAAGGIGIERQTHHAEEPIQQLTTGSTPSAERCASKQYTEGLTSDRNRRKTEWYSKLRKSSRKKGEATDEQNFACEAKGLYSWTRYDVRDDDGNHVQKLLSHYFVENSTRTVAMTVFSMLAVSK